MYDSRLRIALFPCIFLILTIIIGINNWQEMNDHKKSLVLTYTRNFFQGKIGSGYGTAELQEIPFESLEPGDILLGGWPDCAYGQYSHAGLYIGNNQVLETYVDYGVCIQPISHYSDYTELCLLKVNASSSIKKQVVADIKKYQGQLFYPLAFKYGNRYWNCSKIIWKVYADLGIDLDTNKDLWIAPENMKDSQHVFKLYERRNKNS